MAADHDRETRFRYADGGAAHQAVIEWRPGPITAPGRYRVRHQGASRGGVYSGAAEPLRLPAWRLPRPADPSLTAATPIRPRTRARS